jgi:hypothetical protein
MKHIPLIQTTYRKERRNKFGIWRWALMTRQEQQAALTEDRFTRDYLNDPTFRISLTLVSIA